MNAKNLSLGLASLALLGLANVSAAQSDLSAGLDDSALTDGSAAGPFGDPETDANGRHENQRGSNSIEDDDISDDAIDDGSQPEAPGDPSVSRNDNSGASLEDGSAQDSRGRGAPDECPADSNGDGYIGFTDLLAVVAGWGDCPVDDSAAGEIPTYLPCPGDFTRDHRVDFHDLTILLINYGDDCMADALLP